MASYTMTDCGLFINGYDLQANHNAVAVTTAAELGDDTVFGDAARSRLGGLKTTVVTAGGIWDATPDNVYFGNIGVADTEVTICPVNPDDGERAYIFQSVVGEYTPPPLGAVGDALKFNATMESASGVPLVKGTIMHNSAQSATSSGTVRQLGALSASETMYAALHVVAVSGTGTPTLAVKVQSDGVQAFNTTPTDQITFSNATAIGSQWGTKAGAVTDTWWRVTWTITGTTPSFTFIVTMGIL